MGRHNLESRHHPLKPERLEFDLSSRCSSATNNLKPTTCQTKPSCQPSAECVKDPKWEACEMTSLWWMASVASEKRLSATQRAIHSLRFRQNSQWHCCWLWQHIARVFELPWGLFSSVAGALLHANGQHKATFEDTVNIKSHQPISLLSVLFKVLSQH